jgi:hypothetical protein
MRHDEIYQEYYFGTFDEFRFLVTGKYRPANIADAEAIACCGKLEPWERAYVIAQLSFRQRVEAMLSAAADTR